MNSTRAKRIPRVTDERAAERRLYNLRRQRYLAEHPFDQCLIAYLGMTEADVIAHGGRSTTVPGFDRIPRATQIHHRNKCYGARLLDERWWLAVGRSSHDMIENRKGWAREQGFLLPIQADADGRWGSGNQALETPAFMAAKIK